ncbi:hypothetical protein ACEN4H_07405 [Leuconostoc mesenteroides]|uniref:hypothetical protein n=1 Tax=Leuconostoc mesenteroides TaxID=1245 RepID=UPI003886D4D3
MSEPVAYMWKTERGTIIGFTPNDNSHSEGRLGIPLYAAEDLHPRVKMTQSEFDEFKNLFEVVDYASIALATIQHVKDDFNKLGERVYSGTVNERIKKENEFNVLWANYNPDTPEETIEIVPDKKWFVVRKLPNTGGNMLKCSDDGLLMYNAIKEVATYFDTKEEAELWKNPLTEVVLLPVEGDD